MYESESGLASSARAAPMRQANNKSDALPNLGRAPAESRNYFLAAAEAEAADEAEAEAADEAADEAAIDCAARENAAEFACIADIEAIAFGFAAKG